MKSIKCLIYSNLIKRLLQPLIFICFFKVNAQTNLVPNPSFEINLGCPITSGSINLASPWFQTSPDITVDYYNTCATQLGVPSNYNGFQYARTGNSYIGIVLLAFDNSPYREYVQVKMTDELISGKIYCVEFYAALSNSSAISTDSIGVFFSNDSLISNNTLPIICQNQIQNPTGNILSDTINWMKVKGQFAAQGGELFMIIGNFNNFNTTSSLSYYYIDDVSVYECDAPLFDANAGNNVIICKGDSIQIGTHNYNDYIYEWQPATGLSDNQSGITYANPDSTTVYHLITKDFKFTESMDSITVGVIDCNNIFTITPNNDGYNDFLFLPLSMLNCELFIYNRWGQVIYTSKSYQNNWNADEIISGVYFFTATTNNGLYSKGTIHVVK